MSESKMGAKVMYCGHTGWFLADIFRVGNVNVVKARAMSAMSVRDDLKLVRVNQERGLESCGCWGWGLEREHVELVVKMLGEVEP